MSWPTKQNIDIAETLVPMSAKHLLGISTHSQVFECSYLVTVMLLSFQTEPSDHITL